VQPEFERGGFSEVILLSYLKAKYKWRENAY